MTWEPMHERLEKYGHSGIPNIYGDVYERAVEETLNAAEEKEIDGEEVTDEENPLAWVPALDLNNPANLEAFYGNFAFFDHYRKSVLAQCHELLRAQYIESGKKVTETQLDNEARNHPIYKDFLASHFYGREAREQNVRDSLRGGI